MELQRNRRHASGRIITIAALAAGGWLAMSAAAVPSFASNGNGVGLATAPGQVGKQAPATTTTAPSTPTAPATTTASTSTAPVTTGATVGDPMQAQPLSSADLQPGGANNGGDCGAYCSTRNGKAPLNGNGQAQATGKPCAGCVGKADNKNPPGQQPDASDHNNGYECDGNNGIAKTNPAHTGCTTTGTPPSPCTATNSCGGTDCTVTDTCGGSPDCTVTNTCGGTTGDCTVTNTCGGTVGDCTVTSTCPSSTPTPNCVPTPANGFCSTVLGVQHHRVTAVTPPTIVLGEKLTRTPNVSPNVLPFTGADVPGMLGLSMCLLLLGAVAVGLGRRRIGPAAVPVRL